MNLTELKNSLISFRCLMLRYNPIRYPVGLVSLGDPGPESPVLVSGNYFHTVRRLMKTLADTDCYLLVADSAGINVWCAAGVCDFNEHKIADAVNSCGLSELVSHRRLILPQLAAVGVDLAALRRECGFNGIWGPASLKDIPEFLDGGRDIAVKMRKIGFPLEDRIYNAIGMFNVFLIIPLLLALAGRRREAHFALFANFVNIFANFLLYFRLPFKYPSNNSLLVGGIFSCAYLFHWLIDRKNHILKLPGLIQGLAILIFSNILVSIDMLGSTPFYKTTIHHWLVSGDNSSLFQPSVTESCIGCGRCRDVCPGALFEKSGKVVKVVEQSECCECLACVKQCPVGAIVNGGTGFKDDIKSIDISLANRRSPEGRL